MHVLWSLHLGTYHVSDFESRRRRNGADGVQDRRRIGRQGRDGNMTGPAVSVLTATYNRAHVLHRPYESLKRQTVRDFEWVIVDDGSSDETPELLHRWQTEADFPITWYRYDRNRGVNAAVNSGLKVVSGEYVCNLDSDDALLDDAMETIAYFRERTGIDSIPSAYQMAFRCVDQSGALVGHLNEDARKSFQSETVRSSFRNAAYRLGLSFDFITVSKAPVAGTHRAYKFRTLSGKRDYFSFIRPVRNDLCQPSGPTVFRERWRRSSFRQGAILGHDCQTAPRQLYPRTFDPERRCRIFS